MSGTNESFLLFAPEGLAVIRRYPARCRRVADRVQSFHPSPGESQVVGRLKVPGECDLGRIANGGVKGLTLVVPPGLNPEGAPGGIAGIRRSTPLSGRRLRRRVMIQIAVNTIRPGRVDLGLYTDRIGFRGELQPNGATLRALHLAHLAKIPFENIDVLMGRPVSLNIGRLMDKLVVASRGGYCFEQNTLFAAVLESIGFRVSRLAARLRFGVPPSLPRTHMALLVDAEGEKWLADVGYFGCGLLEPMPLVLDREVRQGFRKFMLRRDGMEWVLRCQGMEQFSFSLEPHLPVDLEPLNYYCSTHPEVPGNRELRVQIVSPHERRVLVQRVLTVFSESGSNSVELRNEAEVRFVLRERFGLDLGSEAGLLSAAPTAGSPAEVCPVAPLPTTPVVTGTP